jgi:hypothetical protein
LKVFVRGSADALRGSRGRRPAPEEAGMAGRGNAINFPRSPSFRPSASFVSMATTKEMDDREDLLSQHALVVFEHGPLGLRSTKELKDLLFHHFGLHKHEWYVYHCNPAPFIIIFSKKHTCDVVFATRRVIEGPIELEFKPREVDEFGNRLIIPYHVKLSIEGIPHHAWFKEVADKVVGDEVCIHFIEECARKKIDLRAFDC